MAKVYDVAIIGAGPGGSATAHYLAQAGLDVLLLDKSDFPRDKTCGDGLTPRALHILDDMGILPEISRAGFQINGLELHASSGAMMDTVIPDHSEYPNHLLIVPRLQLDEIIRRRAVQSGAKFESPVRVRSLNYEKKSVRIYANQFGKKLQFHAKLLVIAVGANLGVLQELGIFVKKPNMIMGARAYFENTKSLGDRIQAHFANVSMPGYGWVFPTSKTSANIGLGLWSSPKPIVGKKASIRTEMENFLSGPKIKPMLEGASMQGAIQSYPLRIDFNSAPTFGERILLVGESAGLVSPLTGEGIDFALESGQLAAKFIQAKMPAGDFSPPVLTEYDQILRNQFRSIFRFLNYVRGFYLNPILMDRAIKVANKHTEIKRILTSVLMSQQHPSEMISPAVLRRVIIGN
jgi:geranylgeranyl reductase family protein